MHINAFAPTLRLIAMACAATAAAAAAAQAPMDESLQAALAAHALNPAAVGPDAPTDGDGRLLMEVVVNGASALAPLQQAAARGGALVLATQAAAGGSDHRLLTLSVAPAQVAALAAVPGVRALHLVQPAIVNAGPALSQGVAAMKADLVQASGVTGKGITMAVLSDSYNQLKRGIKAAQDVAAGELPGVGNPFGRTQPVVVLQEGAAGGSDEGRAMLQLIHDVAPDAKLCFAQAMQGPGVFAANVRALADKSGPCAADVIVDDISYWEDPAFSDGVSSRAVDEVVAQGVSYFSCAGNRSATNGFMQDFAPVANTAARGAPNSPVNLGLIPVADTAGGFHNFAPAGKPADIARRVVTSGTAGLALQWNDLFDSGAITTDYDVYVFSADGQTLVTKSTNINAQTDRPFEKVDLGKASDVNDKTLQIVIARRSASPAVPVAARLRYMIEGFVRESEYPDSNTALVYGHNAARTGNSVGATPWYAPDQVEGFSGPGPSYIYFDASGRRLANPTVRQKPDFVAPDETNTSFFGLKSFEDTDKFNNFSGTSAASPHAGGVAALMLEKAGGKGRLTPARVTQLLKQSAAPHDLAPSSVSARGAAGALAVQVDAVGNGQMPANRNPNAFTVRLTAPAGYTLASLALDMTTANASRVKLGQPKPGVSFNPNGGAGAWGFAPTVGDAEGIRGADVSFSKLATSGVLSKRLTLTFAAGTFTPATVLRFGVGHEESAGNGNSAVDLMAGGSFTAVVKSATGTKKKIKGTFANTTGTGWTMLDGWGAIDAQRAVNAVAP